MKSWKYWNYTVGDKFWSSSIWFRDKVTRNNNNQEVDLNEILEETKQPD